MLRPSWRFRSSVAFFRPAVWTAGSRAQGENISLTLFRRTQSTNSSSSEPESPVRADADESPDQGPTTFCSPPLTSPCQSELTCLNSYSLLFSPGQAPIPEAPSRIPPYSFEVFSIIPTDKRNDRSLWIRLILGLLPKNLQRGFSDLEPTTHPNIDNLNRERTQVAINATLFLADRYGGVDVLVYFALHQKRWDIVQWLVKEVLESAKSASSLDLNSLVADCISNLRWAKTQFKFPKKALVAFGLRKDAPGTPVSLDAITNDSPRLAKVGNDYCYIAIGRIWQSLGIMVARATQSSEEAEEIMPHVLQIIAEMHHKNMVPAEVYKYNQKDQNKKANSPIIPFLSSRMMEALSDAAIRGSSPDMFSPKGSFLSKWMPLTPHHTPVFRPELWLEFILWTCVYGGWPLVSARILTFMKHTELEMPWNLIDWKSELSGQEDEVLPSESSERDADIASKLKRSISAEVVEATVNAVISSNQTGIGARGTSMCGIVRYLNVCKDLLDRSKMSLRPLSWSAVVNRLLMSNLVTVELDPTTFRAILKLAHPVHDGSTSSSFNLFSHKKRPPVQPYYNNDDGRDATAFFTLYHHTLNAFVDREDVQGAIQAFNDMLTYGRLIRQFRIPTEDEICDPYPTKPPPDLNPSIPTPVLSQFLDLLTLTGHVDAAKLLLFGHDKHQVMIPPRLHADPFISPAVLRYACAANDLELATKVAERMLAGIENKQTSPKVLAAVVVSQLQAHRWLAARQLLINSRDFVRSRWDPSILAGLAAILIQAYPEGPPAAYVSSLGLKYGAPTDEHLGSFLKFKPGFNLYFDLMKGVFGPCLIGSSTPETINAVLSHLSPGWERFCRQFNTARPIYHTASSSDNRVSLPQKITKPVKIDPRHFDSLLSAVALAHNPTSAIKLVDGWCLRPIPMPEFDEYPDRYSVSAVAITTAASLDSKLVEAVLNSEEESGDDGAFAVYQIPPYIPEPVVWYDPLTPPVSRLSMNNMPLDELEDRLLLEANYPPSKHSITAEVLSHGKLPPILVSSNRDSHVYSFDGRTKMTMGLIRSIFTGILTIAHQKLHSNPELLASFAFTTSVPSDSQPHSYSSTSNRTASIDVSSPHAYNTSYSGLKLETPAAHLNLRQAFDLLSPSMGLALIWCVHRFKWLGLRSLEELEIEFQATWNLIAQSERAANGGDDNVV